MLEEIARENFSVKMRASQGGVLGQGGKHISGAERIVSGADLEQQVLSMLERAQTHQKGEADFINIKVELVKPEMVQYCPLLPLAEHAVATVTEGRQAALAELVQTSVSEAAARCGIEAISKLATSMRGAMLLDSLSGERLDALGQRGVRVTKMDVADAARFQRSLAAAHLYGGDHVREALVLASKVASAPGIVAELCWSDDPDYVTGYVGSAARGYRRIPVLKEKGDEIGGRVFFVQPGADLPRLIHYLQEQVILVQTGEQIDVTTTH